VYYRRDPIHTDVVTRVKATLP